MNRMFTKVPFPISVGLLFAGLTLLNYWPVFLGRVPLPTDVILQFPPYQDWNQSTLDHRHAEIGDMMVAIYPWHDFAAKAIRRGTLPLWNPHLLAGTPFLANSQSALFYPLHLIFIILPMPAAWSI